MFKSNIKIDKYILGFIVAIFGAIYFMLGMQLSIEEAMLFGGGSYLSLDSMSPMQVIISLCPMLVMIYSFSDVFSFDFSTVSVYVFTRTKKRGIWFFSKASDLLLQIIIYWLIFVICYLLVGFICSKDIMLSTLCFTAEVFLLQILVGFFLLLLCNITSLKIPLPHTIMLVFMLHLVSLLTCMPLYKAGLINWIRFIPSANCVYGWHLLPSTSYDSLSEYAQCNMSGFSIGFSITYLLILISALLTTGKFILSYIDLIGLEGN